MTISAEDIDETVRAGDGGPHVGLSRADLVEASGERGGTAIVEVRPKTRNGWIAANAGRVYEHAGDMDGAINELRALPE